MSENTDKIWAEIVSRYSPNQQRWGKAQADKAKRAVKVGRAMGLILGGLLAIAIKASLSGACLLGLHWVLTKALPEVAAIQAIMPFWVAFLGGLFLNLLHAAVTASPDLPATKQ